MKREEFRQWLQQEPELWNQIRDAARTIPPNTLGSSGELSDDVITAVMYPVVSFVLREIGLPWHFEARVYVGLWREKYRQWIDEQLEQQSLHPYALESAGNELRRRLATVSDEHTRSSWEQLARLLSRATTEDSN